MANFQEEEDSLLIYPSPLQDMIDPINRPLRVHFQSTMVQVLYTLVSAEAGAGPVPAPQLLLKGLFAPIGKVGMI